MLRNTKITLCAIASLTLCVGTAAAQSADEVAKIQEALPKKATAKPAKARKLLVFSLATGFKHESIPYGEKAFELMGEATGAYKATLSQDLAVFEPKSLKQFDGILMNNTTGELFTSPTLQESLMDFVKGGKGIVGIHSASDCCYNWPSYGEMIGGYFSGHPWTADCKVTVKIDEPKHALTKAFGGAGFDITDEIYQFKDPYSRHKLRVLASLDTDKTDMTRKGINRTDNDFAVSWVKPFGNGRVFYCSLGHNKHIYWDSMVLQHYLDGIQFVLGDLKADSSPAVAVAIENQNKAFDKAAASLAGHDYGKAETATPIFDNLINSTSGLKAARKELAKRLVAFAVSTDNTFPARELAFRRIPNCADAEDVAPLLPLLKDADAKVAEWTRYAVTPIPGESVSKALRDALSDKADEKETAGIINSLGVRHDKAAAKTVAGFIVHGDKSPQVANAALAALGQIASSESAGILQKAFEKADDQSKAVIGQALAQCAQRLAESGNKGEAIRIYDGLLKAKGPYGYRLAAFTGRANLSGNPSEVALKTLLGSDYDAHTAAAALLANAKDSSLNAKLASVIRKQKPETQVALLEIAKARSAKQALGVTRDLLNAETTAVQSAAISTIGVIGDESAIEPLLKIATDKSSEFGDKARASIDRLPTTKADDALIAIVKKGDADDKTIEAIQSLGRRHAEAGIPELLKTAAKSDERSASEAYKVLTSLATAKEAKALLEINRDIKSQKVRTEADKALLASIRKMEPAESQSAFLVAAVAPAPTSEARASVLKLLGKLGGAEGYKALKGFVSSDDKTIKDAAIRSLADFPSAEPLSDLIALAGDDSAQKVHKVLALRAAVRLLGLESSREPKETLDMAKNLLKLAATDEDKKLIIAGLAEVKQPGVFELIAPSLDTEALSAETRAAVIKLAPDVWAYSPQATSATLAKINESDLTDAQKESLKKIGEKMAETAQAVVGWQASGPFSDPAVQKVDELLKHKFDPETKGEDSVSWKTVTVGSDSKHPEMLELDKTFDKKKNCAAYLRTFLVADEESTASLRIGSDDGILVWINGKEVLTSSGTRSYKKGDDAVTVTLNQGRNELLAKVVQGTGQWRASVLVESPDGGALPGVKVTSTPAAE